MTKEKRMAGFWRGKGGKQRPAVSADFEHALTQEVLRSELIRVKALIATALLLAASKRGSVPRVWCARPVWLSENRHRRPPWGAYGPPRRRPVPQLITFTQGIEQGRFSRRPNTS